LAEFISTFGDVDIYNIQGLEKLNDFTTQQFFRATNKSKFFAPYQLLCLRLRSEMRNPLCYNLIKKKEYKKHQKSKKTLIHENEAEEAWTQFVIDGITLSNYDINNICKTDFSVKVKYFN